MKVLFLSYWFPHKYNRQFCPFALEHARAIHLQGIEAKVLAFHLLDSKKWYKEYVEVEKDLTGLEIHHVYIESWWHRWIYINPWHCHFLTSKYYDVLSKTFSPTLIHANFVGVCSISAMWLAQKHKLKLVITEHWTRVDQYMKNNKLSYLGKQAYNAADAITVVSNFLGEIVGKYVKDKSKIHRVANVIDPLTFAYIPKEAKEETTFTFIGHLRAPKLPLLAIQALEEVAKLSSKKIRLFVFGEGPLRKEIENLIPTLHFELRLMGLRPKLDVATTLQKSDYYLHPSQYETFCVAIAEALSTGTPAIASDNTAIPELITSSNGRLSSNTVKDWKTAILTAMKSNFDPRTIAETVQKQYTYKAIGTQFEQVYQKLK